MRHLLSIMAFCGFIDTAEGRKEARKTRKPFSQCVQEVVSEAGKKSKDEWQRAIAGPSEMSASERWKATKAEYEQAKREMRQRFDELHKGS